MTLICIDGMYSHIHIINNHEYSTRQITEYNLDFYDSAKTTIYAEFEMQW